MKATYTCKQINKFEAHAGKIAILTGERKLSIFEDLPLGLFKKTSWTMALSSQEHRAYCKAIKDVLESGLDQPCNLGDKTETRKQRLLFLASVLQNMSAGTKGAGLSGGVAQENLWKEMLADMKIGFTNQPPENTETAEADYYFKGYPLSHKTIGYNAKNPALALAWSKNPPEGLQRNEFTTSMVILNFKPQSQRAKDDNWRDARQGVHIIPLPDLKEIVVNFSSNNKTDSLITTKYVGELIAFSQSNNYSVYFDFDNTVGEGLILSYWRSGTKGAVPRE